MTHFRRSARVARNLDRLHVQVPDRRRDMDRQGRCSTPGVTLRPRSPTEVRGRHNGDRYRKGNGAALVTWQTHRATHRLSTFRVNEATLAETVQRGGRPQEVRDDPERQDARDRGALGRHEGLHLLLRNRRRRHADAPGGRSSGRLRQPDQHGVGARHGVPRVLHAGRVHGPRSGVRPIAGDGQRPAWSACSTRACAASCTGRSVSRSSSGRATASSATSTSSCTAPRRPTGDDRCRVPRLLALPVRLRRHRVDDHVGRAWSVARASRATSSTASACRASSTRSSVTGSGVRAAGWRTRWAGSATS